MSEHKTTDPLDTLRPEVREALFSVGKRCDAQTFDTLSAELLRLDAVEQKWKQWINDGMRVVVSEQPK